MAINSMESKFSVKVVYLFFIGKLFGLEYLLFYYKLEARSGFARVRWCFSTILSMLYTFEPASWIILSIKINWIKIRVVLKI
jgi:hypothetical protein